MLVFFLRLWLSTKQTNWCKTISVRGFKKSIIISDAFIDTKIKTRITAPQRSTNPTTQKLKRTRAAALLSDIGYGCYDSVNAQASLIKDSLLSPLNGSLFALHITKRLQVPLFSMLPIFSLSLSSARRLPPGRAKSKKKKNTAD